MPFETEKTEISQWVLDQIIKVLNILPCNPFVLCSYLRHNDSCILWKIHAQYQRLHLFVNTIVYTYSHLTSLSVGSYSASRTGASLALTYFESMFWCLLLLSMICHFLAELTWGSLYYLFNLICASHKNFLLTYSMINILLSMFLAWNPAFNAFDCVESENILFYGVTILTY